jgi:hypothetical protein
MGGAMRLAFLAAAIGCSASVLAGLRVDVREFSKGTVAGWQPRSFSGMTEYRLVESARGTVLQAVSQARASGLYREIRVDLSKTPHLNWSWQVDNTLSGPDERIRAGDDYAARLYVVIRGGLAFWRTRALNYVWASRLAVGTDWPNAFAGANVRMLAVRSGGRELGRWIDEKRDVRQDLARFFGEDIPFIDGVALMTDTDNAGGRASACYGDIFFTD